MKWHRALTANWALKLTALGLAVLLWTMLRADAPTRVAVPDVPVQIDMRDPNWVVVGAPDPARVTVSFIGRARDLVGLAVERPQIVIPIETVRDSIMTLPVDPRWVRLRDGMDRSRIEDVRPTSVRVMLERLLVATVPLELVTTGALNEGLELRGPVVVDPPVVRVSGPTARVERVASLALSPIDLSAIQAPGTSSYRLEVDTAGVGDLAIAPLIATVRITVVSVAPEPPNEAEELGRSLPEPTPEENGEP